MVDRMMFGNEFWVLFGKKIDGGLEFGAAVPGGKLLGERIEREKREVIAEVVGDLVFEGFSDVRFFVVWGLFEHVNHS